MRAVEAWAKFRGGSWRGIRGAGWGRSVRGVKASRASAWYSGVGGLVCDNRPDTPGRAFLK
jgi:hypothetical protein